MSLGRKRGLQLHHTPNLFVNVKERNLIQQILQAAVVLKLPKHTRRTIEKLWDKLNKVEWK